MSQANVTQEFLEVAVDPDTKARVTQEFLEVAVISEVGPRITQEFLEASYVPTIQAQLTQLFAEIGILETTTYGFDDCGRYLGPREVEIRLYDSSGKRKSLLANPGSCDDPEAFESLNFEILDRGGFGNGSIVLPAEWSQMTLDGTERADVYLWDTLVYRGRVQVVQKELSSNEKATLTTYGLITTLDNYRIKRAYAYGCAVDVSQVFQDVINDHVGVAGRYPGISVYAQTIGVTLKEFDARGSSVAQALNRLMDLAPNQMYWGADVTTAGNDRLYLRLRPTTTPYRFAVGDDVEAFLYPLDTGGIINRLFVTGGEVKQPNLCANPSFEEVAPADETHGNLLRDPSFEDGTPSAQWTLSNGATVKFLGHATAFGSARTGKQWLELDRVGELAVSQAVPVVAGGRYTASCWGRREDPDKSCRFLLILEGLDNSGTVYTIANISCFPDDSGVYAKFEVTQDWADYPAVTKARVSLYGDGGTASNDGAIIDDVALAEYCAQGPEGWKLNANGNATITAFDWAYKEIAAKHGGYCVKIHPANISVSNDYIEIYLPSSHYVQADPNERYTMLVFWQTNNEGAVSFSFGAQEYTSDYTVNQQHEKLSLGGNANTWQRSDVLEMMTETDTAYIQPFIRVKSNAAIYIDAVMLVKGEVPSEVYSGGGYWTGTRYERVIDVEDSALSGLLNSGVSDSMDDYGEREEARTNDLVIDADTMEAYAAGQFNAFAVPQVEGRLTLFAPRGVVVGLDGKVKIVNLSGAPEALTPSRIQWSVDGAGIRAEVDLGTRRPDQADLLRMVIAGTI